MPAPGSRRLNDSSSPAQRNEPPGNEGFPAPTAPMRDAELIATEAAAIYPGTNVGQPTPEEIAHEAYLIYMSRGAEEGHALDDWLEAERRLSARREKP